MGSRVFYPRVCVDRVARNGRSQSVREYPDDSILTSRRQSARCDISTLFNHKPGARGRLGTNKGIMQYGAINTIGMAIANVTATLQELEPPSSIGTSTPNPGGSASDRNSLEASEARPAEETLHRLELSSFRDWGINE